MSDTPIPDDYNPFDEVEAALYSDRLENAIHPLAEAFVAQFDQTPVTEGMEMALLKFSACNCEAIARRLFVPECDQVMRTIAKTKGLTPQHYIAMVLAWQVGWHAGRSFETGKLGLPEVE